MESKILELETLSRQELIDRITCLDAEASDLAHQLNACNERGGRLIEELKQLKIERNNAQSRADRYQRALVSSMVNREPVC
jgi:regulator of replication initiation timing